MRNASSDAVGVACAIMLKALRMPAHAPNATSFNALRLSQFRADASMHSNIFRC